MKKILIILVSLFCIFPVFAEEYEDKNLYQAGDTVNASGNYDWIAFVAGSDLDINTKSLFGALAGMNIRFNGSISKDLFAFGNSLEINGNIKRDLYAFGDTVKINGVIEGNLYVASNKIIISESSIIKGNIKFYGSNLDNKSSNIDGVISYYEGSNVSGLDNIKTNIMKQKNAEFSIKDRIISVCYSLLRYLFLFLVISFSFPKFLKLLKEKCIYNKLSEYLSISGLGVIGLFVFPFIAFLLLISNIGISVGLIMFILYIILIYLTTIISGYIIGNLICKYLIHKNTNDYLIGLIGISCIVILSNIPYIGLLVSIISLFFGFGTTLKLLINRENRTL